MARDFLASNFSLSMYPRCLFSYLPMKKTFLSDNKSIVIYIKKAAITIRNTKYHFSPVRCHSVALKCHFTKLKQSFTKSDSPLNNNLPFSVFFYTSHIPQNAEFSNQN